MGMREWPGADYGCFPARDTAFSIRSNAPAAPEAPAAPRELGTESDPGETDQLAAEAQSLEADAERALAGLDAEALERQATSVELIRSLLAESRQALDAGDPDRARNLAAKAATMAKDL
jgi:hypothetical protein